MDCSEHWFFACFYELLRSLVPCLFLWINRNPASLPLSMDWFFTCFYEKLGTLIFACFSELTCTGCKAQILSCSYAGNTGTLVCSNWNPASLPDSMDCSESSFFTYYYEKLGTLILCLFLSTHMYWLDSQDPELFLCLEPWNPASLPDSMDCSEPSLYTYYYEKLGTLILCFLWTAPSYI